MSFLLESVLVMFRYLTLFISSIFLAGCFIFGEPTEFDETTGQSPEWIYNKAEAFSDQRDFRKTLDYFDENMERLFPKPQDREIAESILYLCKNKDNIDNFNKKAIYIMIREMTDVKTSKITQVTNTFRKIYPKIQEEVLSRGHIDNLYTGSLM